MCMWKTWESEIKTLEYQCSQDSERYRFARDTTFGRRHLNFWCRSPVLIWIVSLGQVLMAIILHIPGDNETGIAHV